MLSPVQDLSLRGMSSLAGKVFAQACVRERQQGSETSFSLDGATHCAGEVSNSRGRCHGWRGTSGIPFEFVPVGSDEPAGASCTGAHQLRSDGAVLSEPRSREWGSRCGTAFEASQTDRAATSGWCSIILSR